MAVEYIIKGEAGKTLDASDHLLGTDLKAVNASMRFENLAPDVFQWTARTEDIDAGDTIIPDVGQMIEVWSPAVSPLPAFRYFRGWVTQARATNYGVQVVAQGPWMWLEKIDITTSQTGLVNTSERPTIIFNEATVTSDITALLNRAIALGAPVAVGTISSTFTIPKLQLSMMTCADVLAELMRWVPDCVGWWDYSGSGTPTFNLSRRGGMSATTYTVGTSPLVDFDLTGRPDLIPARVEVKYISRAGDGRPQFITQSDGTAVTGRVQVIGLSGEELDTFLPPDDYQSYTVQTYDANASASSIESRLLPMIPEVASSRNQFSGRPNATDVILANGENVTTNPPSGISGISRIYPQPTLQFLNPETGAPISRIGKRFLMSPAPPDWADGVLASAEKVKIVGRIYVLEEKTLHGASGSKVSDGLPVPSWQAAFPWSSRQTTSNFVPSSTLNNAPLANIEIVALDFEIDTFLTTSNYPTPTTIYKPQDFEYLSPPANLAANLRSAQNFTPYEGNIRIVSPSSFVALSNELQYKINIVGSQAGLSTAGALVRAATYDLANSSLDLEIGAPSRFNFSALGGKVRQTPQTNITIN